MPTQTPIRINFQPKNTPAVCGYSQDNGEIYAARNEQTYGWNFSHADGMRDRGALLARPARVVGHAGARNAVAPGAWAVLVEIAPGVGAEQDLDRVRAGLTGCDCGAWLAPNV